MQEFKGRCKGVRLVPRGKDDNHICVQLLTEDDENWFENGTHFSSYWIDELIQQLELARDFIRTQEPDKDGKGQVYGYNFKKPQS